MSRISELHECLRGCKDHQIFLHLRNRLQIITGIYEGDTNRGYWLRVRRDDGLILISSADVVVIRITTPDDLASDRSHPTDDSNPVWAMSVYELEFPLTDSGHDLSQKILWVIEKALEDKNLPKTVGAISMLSREDLTQARNFGPRRVKIVEEALAKFNLSLKPN